MIVALCVRDPSGQDRVSYTLISASAAIGLLLVEFSEGVSCLAHRHWFVVYRRTGFLQSAALDERTSIDRCDPNVLDEP